MSAAARVLMTHQEQRRRHLVMCAVGAGTSRQATSERAIKQFAKQHDKPTAQADPKGCTKDGAAAPSPSPAGTMSAARLRTIATVQRLHPTAMFLAFQSDYLSRNGTARSRARPRRWRKPLPYGLMPRRCPDAAKSVADLRQDKGVLRDHGLTGQVMKSLHPSGPATERQPTTRGAGSTLSDDPRHFNGSRIARMAAESHDPDQIAPGSHKARPSSSDNTGISGCRGSLPSVNDQAPTASSKLDQQLGITPPSPLQQQPQQQQQQPCSDFTAVAMTLQALVAGLTAAEATTRATVAVAAAAAAAAAATTTTINPSSMGQNRARTSAAAAAVHLGAPKPATDQTAAAVTALAQIALQCGMPFTVAQQYSLYVNRLEALLVAINSLQAQDYPPEQWRKMRADLVDVDVQWRLKQELQLAAKATAEAAQPTDCAADGEGAARAPLARCGDWGEKGRGGGGIGLLRAESVVRAILDRLRIAKTADGQRLKYCIQRVGMDSLFQVMDFVDNLEVAALRQELSRLLPATKAALQDLEMDVKQSRGGRFAVLPDPIKWVWLLSRAEQQQQQQQEKNVAAGGGLPEAPYRTAAHGLPHSAACNGDSVLVLRCAVLGSFWLAETRMAQREILDPLTCAVLGPLLPLLLTMSPSGRSTQYPPGGPSSRDTLRTSCDTQFITATSLYDILNYGPTTFPAASTATGATAAKAPQSGPPPPSSGSSSALLLPPRLPPPLPPPRPPRFSKAHISGVMDAIQCMPVHAMLYSAMCKALYPTEPESADPRGVRELAAEYVCVAAAAATEDEALCGARYDPNALSRDAGAVAATTAEFPEAASMRSGDGSFRAQVLPADPWANHHPSPLPPQTTPVSACALDEQSTANSSGQQLGQLYEYLWAPLFTECEEDDDSKNSSGSSSSTRLVASCCCSCSSCSSCSSTCNACQARRWARVLRRHGLLDVQYGNTHGIKLLLIMLRDVAEATNGIAATATAAAATVAAAAAGVDVGVDQADGGGKDVYEALLFYAESHFHSRRREYLGSMQEWVESQPVHGGWLFGLLEALESAEVKVLPQMTSFEGSRMAEVVEALRPGLLAAHPNTWGKLARWIDGGGESGAGGGPELGAGGAGAGLGRAAAGAGLKEQEQERGGVADFESLRQVAHWAVLGLLLLSPERRLPLQMLQMSYCTATGFYCERAYTREMELSDVPVDEHECEQWPFGLKGLVMAYARDLFHFLCLVPSFREVPPDAAWARESPLLRQVLREPPVTPALGLPQDNPQVQNYMYDVLMHALDRFLYNMHDVCCALAEGMRLLMTQHVRIASGYPPYDMQISHVAIFLLQLPCVFQENNYAEEDANGGDDGGVGGGVGSGDEGGVGGGGGEQGLYDDADPGADSVRPDLGKEWWRQRRQQRPRDGGGADADVDSNSDLDSNSIPSCTSNLNLCS